MYLVCNDLVDKTMYVDILLAYERMDVCLSREQMHECLQPHASYIFVYRTQRPRV